MYLTGGEPFVFTNPCAIATYYKNKYPNIEKIGVYTNAYELDNWYFKNGSFYGIDTLSISIKTKKDVEAFEYLKDDLEMNRLDTVYVYVFNDLYPIENYKNFKVFKREWQEDFIPDPNSIFRRI